jgi:hypothetical protein
MGELVSQEGAGKGEQMGQMSRKQCQGRILRGENVQAAPNELGYYEGNLHSEYVQKTYEAVGEIFLLAAPYQETEESPGGRSASRGHGELY